MNTKKIQSNKQINANTFNKYKSKTTKIIIKFSRFKKKSFILLYSFLPFELTLIDKIKNKKLKSTITKIRYQRYLIDTNTNFKGHSGEIRCIIKINNQNIIASCDSNRNIIIWDLPKGKLLKVFLLVNPIL